MSGIMRKIRDETERARFEAARALRLQREQARLGQLRDQKGEQLQALGGVVWEMFEAGQVTDSRLLGVCHQIQDTLNTIIAQEQMVERIKQEQPPEPPKCPRCGREVNGDDAFCPGCGATLASSATQGGGTAPGGSVICARCGKALRPGAAFCGSCGTRT